MPKRQFTSLDSACDAARERLGVTLFTVTVIADDNTSVARIYTSHSEAYPVGGRKLLDKSQTSPIWFEQVLTNQQPFLGLHKQAVREFFFDFETIEGLGCGAIINMPVVSEQGVTIGSINFLAPEGVLTEASVAAALEITQQSTAAVQAGLTVLDAE